MKFISGVDIARAYGNHVDAQVAAAAKDAWAADKPFIDHFIEQLPEDGVVLDVGSGSGNQASYFTEHGLRVAITDGAAEMLSVAREKVPEADARVSTLPDIPFEDDRFDGVFTRHVLQHLSYRDLRQSIGNMSRILKNGGYLAVILSVSSGSKPYYDWWNIDSDDFVKINRYPLKRVRSSLGELGLTTTFDGAFFPEGSTMGTWQVIARKP